MLFEDGLELLIESTDLRVDLGLETENLFFVILTIASLGEEVLELI